MSNYNYGNVPVLFDSRYSQFTVTNTTIAKVLVETQAAAAASGTQPLFVGGFSLIELLASSTDVAKDFIVLEGEVLTTQETTNTGAINTTASGSGTITRANGSFITDGWKIGDQLMTFTPDNTAQAASAIDGIQCCLTAVAATTLTMSGTPIAAQSGLTAGTRLVRVSQISRTTVAASAGNTTGNVTLASNLLSAADASYNKFDRKFGPRSMLIGRMQANVGALTAAIMVTARYAKY